MCTYVVNTLNDMKTTSNLSFAAAASLIAFLTTLGLTQDLIAGAAALAMPMALLTFAHEYAPRSHFVVTPWKRQGVGRRAVNPLRPLSKSKIHPLTLVPSGR